MQQPKEHPDSSGRYARQIQFAPVGEQGQQQLQRSIVAIVGCGALGTVAAEILARAGVGTLRIIDRDIVEWTNLQRQSLFDEQDAAAGLPKAQAACSRLHQINHQITLEPVVADVTADNLSQILENCDLVMDATDNFQIRFLLNDWSLKHAVPWVHGGCVGASGQVRLFDGQGGPCFRCLVPEPPPAASVATCDTAGVLGAATHAIASLQSMEALKWLSGNRQAVHQEVWAIDFWHNRFRPIEIATQLSQSCRACGAKEYDFLEGSASESGQTIALCGRNAVQITPPSNAKVNLQQVAQRWDGQGQVQRNPFFVRLHIRSDSGDDHYRLTLFKDGRAVVEGTDQTSQARTLYDRFVGS